MNKLDVKERRMIELDPGLAEAYLKYNTYKLQRTPSIVHVDSLAKKMKSGLFRFGEIAFVSVHGEPDMMLNGQHVCLAVIASGITVPCMLEKFVVGDKAELSTLFRQFELYVRSLNVMIRVEADGLKLIWPGWVSSLVVAAATIERTSALSRDSSYHASPKSSSHLTKDDRVRLLGKYLDEGAFLYDILVVGNPSEAVRKYIRPMARAAVAFVMMGTWRVDIAAAYQFWGDVRDGENLTRKMPAMQLREFLSHSTLQSTLGRGKKVTNHEIVSRSSIAWNAFRNGKPTTLSYYPEHAPAKLR